MNKDLKNSTTSIGEHSDEFINWIQDLLDDSSISLSDNFLDVGGNSLMAVTLNERLQARHGITLSMKDLFQLALGEALDRASLQLQA